MHGKRWDEGGRRSGNGDTLSYPTVWWSGRYAVTEFIVTSPLTFWKKVRAKDRISPQIETSGSESPNLPRAVGAENGERMESALWVRANSEGGQNEIEIVLSWSKGFVPK